MKIVVTNADTREILHSSYRRHQADQVRTVYDLLEEAHALFPGVPLEVAVCGSGGKGIAETIGAFYVQEVVATALAVGSLGRPVRAVIELGGQDAKVIFLREEAGVDVTPAAEAASGPAPARRFVPSDLRMNGSCAGGTGAFIDQMAELLHLPVEQFDEAAAAGEHVYDISGRCGVFAKTDLQPLLHGGAALPDLALSCFHALAKQTIGGLAQGMEFAPPVLFAGGPLTFNPTLVRVFQERLEIGPDETIIPEHPELFVAFGATLSIDSLFAGEPSHYRGPAALFERAAARGAASSVPTAPGTSPASSAPMSPGTGRPSDAAPGPGTDRSRPFFATPDERDAFLTRHRVDDDFESVGPHASVRRDLVPGTLHGHLGVDAGSTTSKFVLLDGAMRPVYRFYAPNGSDPIEVVRGGLVEMRDRLAERGVRVDIRSSGSTGYGELLFARALCADVHRVETVSHAEAARHFLPDATFVLDIGGQDMKAIGLREGIVTTIVLNEACSAGCGSFLETYARSLGVAASDIASLAFSAEAPSVLGSRCTVFMNSSIITEQRNGRSREEILAGLCRSVIENVFTKVIRMSNLDRLGDRIVVQGGTFRNDAVLRAIEEYLGREVVRPPYPGEMGAIGVALLAAKEAGESGQASTFIGFDALERLAWTRESGLVCTGCANNCSRTVVTFADGLRHVTGNRCERGEYLGLDDADTRAKRARREEPVDLVREYARTITRSAGARDGGPGAGTTIGIPFVLEFYRSLPYWRTALERLGFRVEISGRSTYKLFESGLSGVASDTVCFPAKLVHGHIRSLVARGVDRIFFPMMLRVPRENDRAQGAETCPIVQGYPIVAATSERTDVTHGIPFDAPAFHFFNARTAREQSRAFLADLVLAARSKSPTHESTGSLQRVLERAEPGERARLRRAVCSAVDEADRAFAEFVSGRRAAGEALLADLSTRRDAGDDDFAVVVAGRPYHADDLVSHEISRHFVRLGVPVFNLESLPELESQDVSVTRLETYNAFHTRMIAAARRVASDPRLELVQVVSFGCGHDALLSDEMARILRSYGGKELLVLKVDEGDAAGPLSIRIRSFVETVRSSRARAAASTVVPVRSPRHKPERPFGAIFRKADRGKRVIYAPSLSSGFTYLAASTLRRLGYRSEGLPFADAEAIALGKRYVHNDVCFPAQINIGEMLRALRSGTVDPDHAAMGLAKNCIACRAGQYSALARKALDEAGYPQVPIITTGRDTKHIHPGLRLSPRFHLDLLVGMSIVDGLEEMRQATRPYELERGAADSLFDRMLAALTAALRRSWRSAFGVLSEAVERFNTLAVDRGPRRPRVGIVGEILMNFHESANGHVQRYLERAGMETIIPGMMEFFRKKDIAELAMAERRLHPRPGLLRLVATAKEAAYGAARRRVDAILAGFKSLRARRPITELRSLVEGIIDASYLIGEGWLMPAEILSMAAEGVESFVILNPFGCMPNHITGRGITKALKERFPSIHILALDYDPDTAWANVENRLQMLVLQAKARLDGTPLQLTPASFDRSSLS